MRVILKRGWLVLVPQDDGERQELAAWAQGLAGHVLDLRGTSGGGLLLADLGPKADACNEPIQIASVVKDPAHQLISNFAHTPFLLDGQEYASVEGFWQALKFEDEADRRRVAALWGAQARAAGAAVPYGETITYRGERIAVGSWGHRELMRRACEAKFSRHEAAREALLATKERPLTHRMRHDSRTIPGAIMAEIWMQIRARLRNAAAVAGQEG